MLSRGNVLLLVILLVQLALLAIAVATSSGGQARLVEPIVIGMSAAEIDRLSFSDDLGNEVTLAKSEDIWALPDADNFPVDRNKVEALLAKIASLDTRRLVATNPANFTRLEVDDEEFRRKIHLESENASAELILGGSGGADTVYVRRAGEDHVYLGVGLNSWEFSTQISTWVDASYVSVPQDEVLAITVENSEGQFSFVRAGDSLTYAGLGEDEVLEDTKLPIILRNAATIRMLEPLGLAALDEYELSEPRVRVQVRYRRLVEVDEPAEMDDPDEASESADEQSEDDTSVPEPTYAEEAYTLTFGAKLEDGVVLKSSDAEYYVLARDTLFNAFNDIKRADLVKAPEADGEAAFNPAAVSTPMN